MLFVTPLVSFLVAFFTVRILAPRLRSVGVVGRDMHKANHIELPEMGGFAVVTGFGAGVLLVIAIESFWPNAGSVDLTVLLAVLSTVLLTTLIGIADDLMGIRQWVKALLPITAALPLVALRVGHSMIRIPFIGPVDFGYFYTFFLVPLGVTGAANAVNMLAGFNGLEAGMGIVAMGSLAVIAAIVGATSSLVLLLAGIGALLGILYYNWYPAKVFVGDAGTLSIGAIIAAAVIVGNFETAGLLVIAPYAVDFVFKAINGFPSKHWWGELREDGKLHCPSHGPVGLCQALMKLMGGVHERTLVLLLMGIEAICGIVAITLYINF